jgi:(p)ppGpp synthase/HD superfamily hydrolase
VSIPVAHSNAGLIQQLVRGGYDRDALALVHRTYDLGRTLVSGLHNGDGRPFVNHLVGLASLLHRYGQPPAVVTAGLVHSIYVHGDFGPLRSFAWARASMRRHVGEEVEALVYRFHLLPWNSQAIENHVAQASRYDSLDRAGLVMRLANEVEHLIDGAALHRTNGERYVAWRATRLPSFVALADTLDVPELARDLETTLREVPTLSVPELMREPAREPVRIFSPSYGPRPLAALLARLDAGLPKTGRIAALRARFWPPRG